MKRPAWIAVLIAVAVGAGAAGFWIGRGTHQSRDDSAAQKPEEGDVAAVATVQTERLTSGTITRFAEAYGTIQAAPGGSIALSVPFEAQVEQVLAAPGQTTEASTAVVRIVPSADAQLQLRQAQELLAAAGRNLSAVRQRLSEQLATNADLATAEQAQRAAQIQAQSLSERGLQGPRTIAAGSAGVVMQINVQAGQIVPAGTALAVVMPRQALEALVGVEPADAEFLRPGTECQLRGLDAGQSGRVLTGKIRLIGQQLNSASHLRDVSIVLNDDTPLLHGAFVVAFLPTTTAKGLIVPRSAIVPNADEQKLFVDRDGKAVGCAVELGLGNTKNVLVSSSSLHEGDAVITAGNLELEDGMAVRVEAPATGPSTQPAAEDR